MLDQPLFIDKKSLDDLGIDLKKPTSLQANGVSARTVLRQILAAQGLTFVVKDEAIQVVHGREGPRHARHAGVLPRRPRAGRRAVRRRSSGARSSTSSRRWRTWTPS